MGKKDLILLILCGFSALSYGQYRKQEDKEKKPLIKYDGKRYSSAQSQHSYQRFSSHTSNTIDSPLKNESNVIIQKLLKLMSIESTDTLHNPYIKISTVNTINSATKLTYYNKNELNMRVTSGIFQGATLLHLATYHLRYDLVRILVLKGADHTLEYNGMTPYDMLTKDKCVKTKQEYDLRELARYSSCLRSLQWCIKQQMKQSSPKR